MRQDQSNVRQKCGSRFRRRISVEFNSLNWIRHGRNATYEPGLRFLMTNLCDIKGLSVNVRELNKSLKLCAVSRWLHHQNGSFIFLQETYTSKGCENTWRAEWGGEIVFNHSTNRSKRTIILFHPKLNFKIEKQITDQNGRYIILDGMFADTRLVFVNIYAPNDVHQQVFFFKELQHQFKDYAEETIIIGGDFNCTLTDIDRKGGNPFSRKKPVIQEINKLCNMYELTDIWRQRNPNEEKEVF